MPSFRRALDVGAETIEIDVRRLADGTLIVHHDERWNGKPLARLHATAFSRSDPHRPPALEEVVDFARANNLRMTVELKEAGYEQRVLDTVLARLPNDRVTFMSFDEDAVRAVKELRPNATAGWLMYELPMTRVLQAAFAPGFPVRKAQKVGADFLAVHRAMATESLIARSERAGMPLAIWTVDEPQRLARLLADPRVDNVITNRPDIALSLRATPEPTATG